MTQAAPSVTREQAALIAQLLRSVRPAWDQAVTGKFVVEASREHRDLADLLHGCVRIAQDHTLTSPAALTFAGGPWERTVRIVESAEEREARIQTQFDAREERARGFDDTRTDRAAAAKADIHATLAAGRNARLYGRQETTDA